MTLWGKEPAVIAAAVRACFYAAILFGLDWTDEQLAGFMIAVEAIMAVLVRQTVTSPETVEKRKRAARRPLEREIPLAERGALSLGEALVICVVLILLAVLLFNGIDVRAD